MMSDVAAVFRTLRGHLVLLVCFATLPALLFTFYAAGEERAAALRRIEKEALLLAQLASREHAHQLEGAQALLHRLAALEAEAPAEARYGCPDFFAPLLAGYPQFTTIGILSNDGDLLCSAHPAPAAVTFAKNAAFQRALGSTATEVGEYTVGPVVPRPVLHVAYAVRDAAGAPREVVFVGLDLAWLDQLVAQADLPNDWALLISDQEGEVLGRSQGASWPAGRAFGSTELRLAVRDGKPATVEVPGAGRLFVLAVPMRGVPGVSVVATLPYAHVGAEANRAFYRTVAALGVLTLVTIACALFAAEISVLRVLRALARTARRLGEGDLAVRADASSSQGELADLTRSFNTMADALAARQREAEGIQERLRALSHNLAIAKETEAGRIARELHDELGQILTSVKMDVAALPRRFGIGGTSADGAVRAAAAEINQRLDEAVASIRRISADLRPPVLDRLGLAAALQAQVRELEQRTGLAIVLDVGVEEPVDWLVAVTLYRIAGEALTNVVRHAGAESVSIDLREDAGGYALEVRDDGRGITHAEAEGARAVGIAGMRERCLLVGGRFEISGLVGGGTSVLVTIPRPAKAVTYAAHLAR